jgi:hypothetical protein
MGNRGGRFHRDDRSLGTRRWASRAWICCRLEFKGRHREVWGAGYTELFFLDEPTAFAAGHRPCFECRRAEAQAFAAAFARGEGGSSTARAGEMDLVLHAQRLDGRRKRRHRLSIDALPEGAFFMLPQKAGAFAVRDSVLLSWTPLGYRDPIARPSGIDVEVITPPAILAAFAHGYLPRWHPSARFRSS